jgi:hypothetical protein
VSGEANTAIGSYALLNSKGSYNVSIGDYSLIDLASGRDNTAVGQGAGYTLRTGSNNIFIGR